MSCDRQAVYRLSYVTTILNKEFKQKMFKIQFLPYSKSIHYNVQSAIVQLLFLLRIARNPKIHVSSKIYRIY